MLLDTKNSALQFGRWFMGRIPSSTLRTILLVEHRDEVFSRIAEDLRRQGFNVERACTTGEACEKFATTQAGLIVANRELSHEESGWLLVSKWALARRQRRIWLYTASPQPFDEQWCRFTKVEKLLYHEGSVWKLSEQLLSQLPLTSKQILVDGPTSSHMRRPVFAGSCKRLLMFLLAIGLLLTCFSEDALAKGRGRSRQSAAAAKAAKQRTISAVQKQVAAARQVLAAAESQSAMSQTQVTQAVDKLSEIREAIKSAQAGTQEAANLLQDIEAEIVGEQTPDSELVRAQANLETATQTLHRVMHRVVTLPDDSDKSNDAGRLGDLAKLSPEERDRLEQDPAYQTARDNWKTAARNFKQCRQKLLEADEDWVAARQDLADAKQSVHESEQQSQTAGLGSLGDRQDLRQAQNIAATARAAVAQGEARLRQLGVNPSAGQASSSAAKKKKTR